MGVHIERTPFRVSYEKNKSMSVTREEESYDIIYSSAGLTLLLRVPSAKINISDTNVSMFNNIGQSL